MRELTTKKKPDRMFRGCFVVTGGRGMPPMFSSFEPTTRQEIVRRLDNTERTAGHHAITRPLVDGFLGSMKQMATLCQTPIEKKFYSAIQNVLKQTDVSTVAGNYYAPVPPIYYHKSCSPWTPVPSPFEN